MIKKGDKLIIIAEALEDEKCGTVYVKLSSDSQSNMVVLTENCIVAPKPMDNYEVGSFQDGYNQALRDCGVLKTESEE